MKKAFSLLSVIVFLLILSVLLGVSFSLMQNSTQKTDEHYLYSQAQLLAMSATEYAIMAIQGQNLTNCLKKIDMSYQNIYDINISLYYFGNGLPANCPVLANDIQYQESNSSILIDVRVRSTLPNQNPITYIRRTLQKL